MMLLQALLPGVKLETSTDTLDRLWAQLAGQRRGAATITIDRADLVALLRDHATMANAIREE